MDVLIDEAREDQHARGVDLLICWRRIPSLVDAQYPAVSTDDIPLEGAERRDSLPVPNRQSHEASLFQLHSASIVSRAIVVRGPPVPLSTTALIEGERRQGAAPRGRPPYSGAHAGPSPHPTAHPRLRPMLQRMR